MRKILALSLLILGCVFASPSKADDAVAQPVVTFDERSTQELLDEARSILLKHDGPYDKAMEDLRSIILTQPVALSRTAHELLGYAYEKSKMEEKAMREYELYLSLYPEENDDRLRVRQRLMALEILVPHRSMYDVSKKKNPKQGDSESFTGAASEYVYVDSSGGVKQVNSLTGVQATYTKEHNQYVLTTRVRLTELRDFSNANGNRTNLYNAYVDFEDTFKGYGIRVGRQNSVAGAISRFDGLSARTDLSERVKIEVAAGIPYSGYNSTVKRHFIGAETTYYASPKWIFGAYVNRGTADGVLERSALGLSANYFKDNKNILLRTEYDTLYHTLNMISLQSMVSIKDYDIFALYERRKSPIPFIDSALSIGLQNQARQYPYASIGELFYKSGLSTTDIYNFVSNAPTMTTLVAGASKKLNKKWRLTNDVAVSNLSTVPEIRISPHFDPIPVQVGQSNSYAFTSHLRGEDVFRENNAIEYVVSRTYGATKSAYATVADNYRFGKEGADSASVILRYDVYSRYGRVNTVSGILRVLHKVNKHGMLEAQYSQSMTHQPIGRTQDQTLYVGYRYDW